MSLAQADRLLELLLSFEIRLNRILLKCLQCRVRYAVFFTRIQKRVVLFIVVIESRLLLFLLLLFQFIDSICYRLPIMIAGAGQPKNILQNEQRVGKVGKNMRTLDSSTALEIYDRIIKRISSLSGAHEL